MTLDARRARLWQAMGLGPIYQLRSQVSVELRAQRMQAETEPALRVDRVVPDRAATIAGLPWNELREEVARCRACSLCETRKQTVFGVGNVNATWMLIGEAPGSEEDQRGEPFVGQAGRLLDNMLRSLGMTREGQTPQSVYIANVLKCRPPGNRNPQPEEVARCEPFLRRQVELVNPAVVVVMGRFAAQSLLGTDASIANLRGRVHRIISAGREIPVIVTYHPAYLLRNLADKAKSWADLSLARATHSAGATR
ncbi:MAG: uracil-DNA glycosylase [Burkholderiaceae bacterium]